MKPESDQASLKRSAKKVLVLGDGTGAFLSVIRSLGRKGIEVHVAWSSSASPAIRSRYVAKHHSIPSPSTGLDWRSPLIKLLQDEQFELVIPTNEQSIRPLQRARHELQQLARFALCDDSNFETVFDKRRSTELAESLGVPTPRSVEAVSFDDVLKAAASFGFPLVLKPLSSYADTDLSRRRNVAKAYSQVELKDAGERMLQDGPILVQENFVGIGVGIELLACEGRVLFAFQHERVHSPPRGGASSYRKSVPLDSRLLEAAAKMVASLNYTGVMMVEFLLDPVTREFRFVELNGRFWGSLPLALAAGADFPYFLYQMQVEGKRDFPASYRANVFCRNLVGDIKWAKQNFMQRGKDPTLAHVSAAQTLAEFRHLFLFREYSDTFALDDPAPGFAEIAQYVKRSTRNIADRIRLKVLQMSHIRSRRHQTALARLRSARTVAFVCYGNICRSAFAEKLAQAQFPGGLRTLSCGTFAKAGRSSPAEAIRVAAEFGVSLSEHRAQALSESLVNECDLLLTFDESIHAEAIARFPRAEDKLERFALLAPNGSLELEDPYGKDDEQFHRVFERIANILQAALADKPASTRIVNHPAEYLGVS